MDTKLGEMSDEQLVARMQANKSTKEVHDTFALLVLRYEAKMTRYANKFLYTYEDRQDAVQEVFIKVYKNIQSFKLSEKFSPWVYRIAHNTFINVIKKQKKEKVAIFDADTFFAWHATDDSVQERHEQKLDREILNQCLSKIDAKYREPLVLYYFEEKDYKEIAEIMHVPVSTVGIRLRRGRAKAKEVYDTINGGLK